MSSDNARSLVQTRLSQAEVDAVCAKHDRLWSSKPGGARAVFAFKDISGVNLEGRNLCDADFTGAIMNDCHLRGARLDNATLFCADLTGADLRGALLDGPGLRDALFVTQAQLASLGPRAGSGPAGPDPTSTRGRHP